MHTHGPCNATEAPQAEQLPQRLGASADPEQLVGKTKSLGGALAAFAGSLLILCSPLATADTWVRNATYNLDIPSQSLSDALKVLALASGHKLLYTSELVNGKSSPALKGSYTTEQALQRLLNGTDLTYEVTSDGVVLIRALTAAANPIANLAPAGTENADPVPGDERHKSGAREPAMAAFPEAELASRKLEEMRLEEIVVTGTHIARTGFVTPTPTTVLTAEDLQLAGRIDLGTIIADLPYARSTVNEFSNTTGITAGGRTSSPDLRGLGVNKTLVLIDGRRPVPLNASGSVNMDTMPIGMVERVEVVTGGASAAYGSDAIAGVINIIMADRLDGLRMSAQYGDTWDRSGDSYKVDASYGFSFADDRAHVILGGNYNDTSIIAPQDSIEALSWNGIANPAATSTNGEPAVLIRPDVFFQNTSLGGLIVGCSTNPAGAPPLPPANPCGGLRGRTFDADGTTRPFALGEFPNGSTMSGGDVQATNFAHFATLRVPSERQSAYGRFTFDLTDNLQLKTDLSYSRTEAVTYFNPHTSGNSPANQLIIRQDNAFLPAATRAAMQAANIGALRLGRVNADFGLPHTFTTNETMQGAIGLAGSFGDNWSWDVFYAYGESSAGNKSTTQINAQRLGFAVDAIMVNGQPQCRSLAANPSCVPINVFGPGAGSLSAGALEYIRGATSASLDVQQQETAAVVRGTPFSWWAGPVSLAAGGEWRRQELHQVINNPAIIAPNNAPQSDEVAEGFFETLIPLARDLPLMKSLELNGAVRSSDYERAGSVTSWKIGLSNAITDELRLRFTRSRDIRAPALSELYQPVNTNQDEVTDNRTFPGIDTEVTVNQGSTDDALESESALTTTIGLVYRPAWAPDLNLSLDFYRIRITGFITFLEGQEILDRCLLGNVALCAQINDDPSLAPFSPTSTDPIVQIDTGLVNLAEHVAGGADFEASYRFSLKDLSPSLNGVLTSRLLVTYVDELSQYDGFTRTENDGVVGDNGVGVARLRARLDERYQLNNLSLTLRARYVDGPERSRTTTNDMNELPSATYLDVGAEYRMSFFGGMSLYGNVVNALDRTAPRRPSSAFYDVLGRAFNVGVRVTF